ncbi:MAG: hypothetical protein ABIS67_05825, partial [Candidatus Eisenbacteria bacterium]
MRSPNPLLTRRPARQLASLAFAGFVAALSATDAALAHEPLGISLEALSRSIAADPDNAALRLRRAEMRRIAGSFDAAALDLDFVESLDPLFPGLVPSRALVALDRGDAGASLDVLDAAPPSTPEAGERARLRARAFTALRRNPEAVAAWNEVLDGLERVEPEHYVERARLQVVEGR